MSAKDYANATIIRAKHDNEYFCMHRKTAQDDNLSFEARGMIAYLLSKPDTWEIRIDDLKQKCAKGRVYRILDELAEHGYLQQRQKEQDAKGRWQWTPYKLHERPIKKVIPISDEIDIQPPYTENADTEQPYPGFPDTEKPYTENADILDSTEKDSTDFIPRARDIPISDFSDKRTPPIKEKQKSPLSELSEDVVEIGKAFSKAFPEYVTTFKDSLSQDMTGLEALLERYNKPVLLAAIEKSAGRVHSIEGNKPNPIGYIAKVCETENQKIDEKRKADEAAARSWQRTIDMTNELDRRLEELKALRKAEAEAEQQAQEQEGDSDDESRIA